MDGPEMLMGGNVAYGQKMPCLSPATVVWGGVSSFSNIPMTLFHQSVAVAIATNYIWCTFVYSRKSDIISRCVPGQPGNEICSLNGAE